MRNHTICLGVLRVFRRNQRDCRQASAPNSQPRSLIASSCSQVQGLLPLEPLRAPAPEWHCPPAHRDRRLPQCDGSIPAGKCFAATARLQCCSQLHGSTGAAVDRPASTPWRTAHAAVTLCLRRCCTRSTWRRATGQESSATSCRYASIHNTCQCVVCRFSQ